MSDKKTITEWMADKSIRLDELVDAVKMDRRIVQAIVDCRYTPSPDQRVALSSALGIEPDQIAWGHASQVEHIHGHGPQFGRTP